MNLVNKEYHKRANALIAQWQDTVERSAAFELPSYQELTTIFDHVLLDPEASISALNKVCREARSNHYASVCVNPAYVERCVDLVNKEVAVSTVVGFPLGTNHTQVKALEAELAVTHGATEIAMVINVGLLKTANYQEIFEDIKAVRLAGPEAELKVILESSSLTEKELVVACLLAREAGADFVQSSTGFSSQCGTPEQVSLMRFVVGEDLGVVAAERITTRSECSAMIKAGASRIATFNGPLSKLFPEQALPE